MRKVSHSITKDRKHLENIFMLKEKKIILKNGSDFKITFSSIKWYEKLKM